MSFDAAISQFSDNIALLGGETVAAQTQPEKFNLYYGLKNIARGILEIQQAILNLQR